MDRAGAALRCQEALGQVSARMGQESTKQVLGPTQTYSELLPAHFFNTVLLHDLKNALLALIAQG